MKTAIELWFEDELFLLPSCRLDCSKLTLKQATDGTYTCLCNDICVKKAAFAEKMDKRIKNIEKEIKNV